MVRKALSQRVECDERHGAAGRGAAGRLQAGSQQEARHLLATVAAARDGHHLHHRPEDQGRRAAHDVAPRRHEHRADELFARLVRVPRRGDRQCARIGRGGAARRSAARHRARHQGSRDPDGDDGGRRRRDAREGGAAPRHDGREPEGRVLGEPDLHGLREPAQGDVGRRRDLRRRRAHRAQGGGDRRGGGHARVRGGQLGAARLQEGVQPAGGGCGPAGAVGQGPGRPRLRRLQGRGHGVRLLHPQGVGRARGARVPRRRRPGGRQADPNHLQDREPRGDAQL
mmetsp:Transcript_48058/g.156146  ORF Transcript_48058/g.156146 Transcript_48058/m.156146 type:complete len:284 (+) Transcript_48058:160-1011(+)